MEGRYKNEIFLLFLHPSLLSFFLLRSKLNEKFAKAKTILYHCTTKAATTMLLCFACAERAQSFRTFIQLCSQNVLRISHRNSPRFHSLCRTSLVPNILSCAGRTLACFTTLVRLIARGPLHGGRMSRFIEFLGQKRSYRSRQKSSDNICAFTVNSI